MTLYEKLKEKEDEIKQKKVKLNHEEEEFKRDLIDKSNFEKVSKLKGEIASLQEQYAEQMEDFENLCKEGIFAMTSRKKTMVGKSLTIRKESVYKYASSYEASLKRILKNKGNLISKFGDKENEEKVGELKQILKLIKEEKSKNNKWNTLKIDKKNIIAKTKRYYGKVEVLLKKEEDAFGRYSFQNELDKKDNLSGKLDRYLKYEDEIRDSLLQLKGKAEKMIEENKEKKEKLESIVSSYISLMRL